MIGEVLNIWYVACILMYIDKRWNSKPLISVFRAFIHSVRKFSKISREQKATRDHHATYYHCINHTTFFSVPRRSRSSSDGTVLDSDYKIVSII